MKSIQRILLPTDFSPCSRAALDYAVPMARALGAELVLLHVVSLPPGLDRHVTVQPEPGAPPVALDDYVTRADGQSLEGLAAIVRAAGVAVRTAVEIGPIPATIVSRVEQDQADLLIMGTHGRTGLRRMLLGSVAERLVRVAPVPVLVIRHEGEDTVNEEDEQAQVEAEG